MIKRIATLFLLTVSLSAGTIPEKTAGMDKVPGYLDRKSVV